MHHSNNLHHSKNTQLTGNLRSRKTHLVTKKNPSHHRRYIYIFNTNQKKPHQIKEIKKTPI
ncbi:hypothetical protein HanRHA438_Chr15g0732341 [Helianthus annuus]|nr:hypothetical protein HanIR_Chr15g0783501 [Helianthus annuus]KAJ0847100.1 hypothetical protein HanRHA438_Chr15g0732341 [Helianthus annuus]